MDPAIKWIGGISVAAALVFASAMVAGKVMDGSASPELTADDVLDFDKSPSLVESGAEAGPDPVAPQVAQAEAPKPSIAANEPFVIKRVLDIKDPIKYGQWYWDEAGAPADAPLVMTVDLDARVLSVFRGGYEIGATAVLLGTDEYPTPLGRFPILSKERHNVSEKYDNAPMPWTLRLTWEGIAIHGGHSVENGYASHGCISTPDAFQSKLFDIAKKGDVVIITRGKTTGVGQSLLG